MVTVVDATALTIGIVIGAGIFRTPSIIAANASSEWTVYMAWSLGGVISLIGALVYAELASTYPHAGGEYRYLTLAFGFRLSFAWARMSVIQTGSIALAAFVFGDYAGRVISLGGIFIAALRRVGHCCFDGFEHSRRAPWNRNAEPVDDRGSARCCHGDCGWIRCCGPARKRTRTLQLRLPRLPCWD